MVTKAKSKASTRATLGVIYEDSISGFTGTAIERFTSINGCVQVLIQPRVSDDKPHEFPKGEFVFESQLRVVGGTDLVDSTPDPAHVALLGKRYRDKKTGFAGYAGGYRELLNGTIMLSMDPPVDDKGAMQRSYSIDIADLECIEMVSTPAGAAPRGGPNVESPTR